MKSSSSPLPSLHLLHTRTTRTKQSRRAVPPRTRGNRRGVTVLCRCDGVEVEVEVMDDKVGVDTEGKVEFSVKIDIVVEVVRSSSDFLVVKVDFAVVEVEV